MKRQGGARTEGEAMDTTELRDPAWTLERLKKEPKK